MNVDLDFDADVDGSEQPTALHMLPLAKVFGHCEIRVHDDVHVQGQVQGVRARAFATK